MGFKKLRIFFIASVSAGIFLCSCSSKKIVTDARSAKGKTELKGSLEERYSAVLGVPEKRIQNQKLYKFLDDWMGVPYRAAGTTKSGVDCSGFTTVLEDEVFNRKLPRVASQMANNVKRKYEEQLKEGDLVFFDFNGRKFSHVGVYLANNKFVHASTSRGVIISDLKDPWYYKYFSRCGSLE